MSLTDETSHAEHAPTPAPDMPSYSDLMPPAIFPLGAELSPDGSLLAYVRSTPDDKHTVLVQEATLGGQPRQLAVFGGHDVMALGWSPDGATVAVNATTEHNPIPAIHLLPLDGAGPRIITGPNGYPAIMAERPFNHAGTTLALATMDRDPSVMDLVIHNLADDEIQRVEGTPGKQMVPVAFSPDDKWLLLKLVVDNSNQGVALLDVATHELTEVIAPDGSNEAGLWLPDSSGFYLSTNYNNEFAAVALYTIADNTTTIVKQRPWDITMFGFQSDTWVIISNVDGVDVVEAEHEGQPLALPDIARGSVTRHASLTQDGRYLCLTSSRSARASEILLIDLVEGIGFTLTDNQPAAFTKLRPVEPELVRFTNPDGQEISAWSYRPTTDPTTSTGPVTPVVLWIHGGPELQERPSYNPLYQWLLARGIGVLAPNIRGSVGYGTSFQKAIYGEWGGIDLEDLRSAVEWLQAQPWVDPAGLFVVGESYGGFAALSCLTRMPDIGWAGGIACVAPSDLYALAVSSSPLWTEGMRSMFGDPLTDRDRLIERSPISHVDQMCAPVMMRQPVRDPLVRADQAERFVAAARKAGKDITYVPEGGAEHGSIDLSHRIQAGTEMGEFVVKVLAGRG